MQFDERLCFLKGTLKADNKEQLLKQMAERMYEYGYVKEGFLKSILDREEEYPTGLRLYNTDYHIAIPHSDPEYVKADAAAAAILEKPVTFHRMDDKEQCVEVSLVILLAIQDASEHMRMLSGIVRTLQNPEAASSLMEMRSKADLAEFLKNIVEEEDDVSE